MTSQAGLEPQTRQLTSIDVKQQNWRDFTVLN